jgi:hypothetical protein
MHVTAFQPRVIWNVGLCQRREVDWRLTLSLITSVRISGNKEQNIGCPRIRHRSFLNSSGSNSGCKGSER